MDQRQKDQLNKALASSFGKPKLIPKLAKPIKRKRTPEHDERQRIMGQNRLVTVDLTMRHHRNGTIYGPGRLKLARGLALELQGAEERSRKVDEQFTGTKAAIIGPRTQFGHKIIPVAYEQMSSDSMDFIRDSDVAVKTS